MENRLKHTEILQIGHTTQKTALPCFDPILLFLMTLAAVFRLASCFSDFWLDEIWTLFCSNQLNSPIEIFTKFNSSNNHHLNTFIFYLLGDRDYWIVYRIPSLIAGIGTVPLVWLVARRTGKQEAVIASLLTAGSYLMIHYSSEARGYALVVFFAVATLFTVERFSDCKRWPWAVMFWLCACLGFLSHLMYLHVFIATAVWLLFQLIKSGENKLNIILRYTQCFGVPIIFLGCFHTFVISNMVIDGGPSYKLIDILLKTLSYAGGGPASGSLSVAISIVIAGLFLSSIIRLWLQGRSEWLFYLIVIFLSPIIVLVVKKPDVLFVRYFLISIIFGYISMSFVLADLYRKGRKAMICVVIITLLFLTGNGERVSRLIKYGRGGYLEGIRYMEQNTPGQVITLASDHDFRNGIIINYYKRFLSQGKRILYISADEASSQTPMWMISHCIGEPRDVFSSTYDRYGNIYRLTKVLPYSDLSGWHWLIYRKQELAGFSSVK